MNHQPNDRIPFIRLLNATEHDGDEIWVLAGLARLLNVLRVWTYEIETKLAKLDEQEKLTEKDMQFLVDSCRHATQMLKQSYVVVNTQQIKSELAYLEEELFKFETLYIQSNICLVITEEHVEFHLERYDFLRHGLHGVLHDLSRPIASMMSMVEMLREQQIELDQEFHDDGHELVIQIKSQLNRGFELIKGSFAVEEINIDDLVRITQDTFDTLLKPENIQYQLHQDIHQGKVVYSRMWFRGLLSNIVDNAKKSFWLKGEQLGHGDFERTIRIKLNQAENSANRSALTIRISDTGVGFNQEVLDHGFSEGRSGWHDNEMIGQGVGMAAHVQFIKKLGGEVVLHNLNDQGHIEGAELVVKLPLI